MKMPKFKRYKIYTVQMIKMKNHLVNHNNYKINHLKLVIVVIKLSNNNHNKNNYKVHKSNSKYNKIIHNYNNNNRKY